MKGPFFATIMMTSGEEVLAEVCQNEEHGVEYFILFNPIVIEENYNYDDLTGALTPKITSRKWLRFSQDDMVIVHMDKVITISELDKYGISYYQKYLLVAKIKSPVRREMQSKEHTGFLGTVDEQRKQLEDLFNKDSEKEGES